MEQVLLQLRPDDRRDRYAQVYRDTEDAIAESLTNGRSKELAPAHAQLEAAPAARWRRPAR